MPPLYLSVAEKKDAQTLVESLQKAGPGDLSRFTMTFLHGNEAAWYRFIKGTYNHPITWWIGIFQLQMQMGIWGPRLRSAASARASTLWQISAPLRDEAQGRIKGDNAPLLSAIVRYNLKHRKADIIGRLLGGTFTNYASTGGRLGRKHLANAGKTGTVIKVTAAFTNFGIASYGAAIKAVGEGAKTVEAVIQSILTGRAEHLPQNYRSHSDAPASNEEGALLENLEAALAETMALTQAIPGPVPIKEFCARPENINLKGLCK